MSEKIKIGVIGLGYVGLPLAVEFGKYIDTIGFDINEGRIKELENGHDRTLEVEGEDLKKASKLTYTFTLKDLKACNYYIVTVPTPIDKNKRPDLTPLIRASETVGKVLSKNDIVIYESTVYPGATEEECVPVLEKHSGLKFNKDFYCGYSPERINPGDKVHTFTTIKKVTASSFTKAILISRCEFSITLAASATLMDDARCVPAVTTFLYNSSTFLPTSGVDPAVTFLMVVKVCTLSPGLIRSGEYPQ